MDSGLLLVIIIFAIVILGAFISIVPQLRLLKIAKAAGLDITFSKIAGMKMRKTNAAAIIKLLIKAKNAGVTLTSDMLETLVLAGSKTVGRVIDALISAKQAGLGLDFKLASAVDLSGGDSVEFVDRLKSTKKPYTEQELREAAHNYIDNLGDMAAVKGMSK